VSLFGRGPGLVVGIEGDPKGLQRTLATSERDIKGWGSRVNKAVAGLVILGGVKIAGDFAGDAIAEADRLGDAATRLELQLGKLSDPLKDTAGDFADIGLSAQDVLELEAAFADVGTALKVADPLIAQLADDAAATAGAISLLQDKKPDEVLSLIGKAAGGSIKAMKELGISVDETEVVARALKDTGKLNAEALTDQELAGARMEIVMERLAPKLKAVESGEADVESATRGLGARWETFMGKLGQHLEGPLSDLLTWFSDMLDAIPNAIQGWQKLGRVIGDALTPIARVADVLREIDRLLRSIFSASGQSPFDFSDFPTGGGGFSALAETGGMTGGGYLAAPVTFNIYGDPAAIRAAVVGALQDYTRHNGFESLDLAER